VWIINATLKSLVVLDESSHNMKQWEFTNVNSQTLCKFCVESSGTRGIFINDSIGVASFVLDGTKQTFDLVFKQPGWKGQCGLEVDWKDLDLNKYSVFPPPPPGGTVGELGWIDNGYLSLLIKENCVKATVTCCLPEEDSVVGYEHVRPCPHTYVGPLWMEYYSLLLGKLTLTDMTLPGTHDSGTYHPVSCIGSHWVRTQHSSLADQLQSGIRVLDLRIGQNSPGDYIIVHDVWRTQYTLSQALKEVRDFIDATKKELVVLDFHRFVNVGSGSYDYNQLKDQIRLLLKGYCLPCLNHATTLNEIWKICGSQRVIVAWNGDDPDNYMWPGVNQRWYSNANSKQKLYAAIRSDMLQPPTGMWAACSFLASSVDSPIYKAKLIGSTITRWYFGGSVFCQNANIISVDFFDEYSTVVQASIIANLLKGGAK